jgi:predicted NAD/FAD-binding protein
MKRIAIIGGGISGIGAAYALKDTADVTLYEKRPRLGGHAWTYTVDYDGKDIPVDLGFIVYNGANYPNLVGLFEALKVETKPSDMSFAVSDPNGWTWASNPKGLFAQKRNLLSPKFHRFWRTILKFNDVAREELAAGSIDDPTLGAWLDRHGYDDDFRENYILPMGAAIWSTPENEILDYPASSFFQFFENHRLMHKERPAWRTVKNGSQSYVRKADAALGARIQCGDGVASLAPFDNKVRLTTDSGTIQIYDDVILAGHANQSLDLIDNHYEDQAFLLNSVKYRPNTIYLHRDPSLMPSRKAAWASWNVIKQGGEDICLTYWMNLLQGIEESKPLFITLNPNTPPREDLTFFKYQLDHPQFNAPAEAAVRSLKRIQGKDNLWFAGAWMGRGFHEDGLKSGLAAALSLGGRVPWVVDGVDIYAPHESTPHMVAAAETGNA